ncbi:NRDE family protein [Alcaligenaceae bacterium]|nr:NRDE family protein [Alcaligenaceae bacterium]
MCIAYIAVATHPNWPLFIAANRDEFHNRPTLAAAPWKTNSNIIGGIDCLGKGTWLGITRQGRFALLTNFREPGKNNPTAPSRGELVSRYLDGNQATADYMAEVHQQGAAYNGFNLLAGDASKVCYVGNRSKKIAPDALIPGRYVVSNHLLNTPWPKAERLRRALDALPLDSLEQSLNPVFSLLKDLTPADDEQLPATGLSLEQERLLSSPFIISPNYGTRCSTVIAMHASGRIFFSEVSYDPAGIATERHDWLV